MAIPGTTRPRRLDENNGAADVELSEVDLAEIGAALDRIDVKGDPYPANIDRRSPWQSEWRRK